MLETERLLLRPWAEQEASVLRELWSERDPRVPAHRRIDAEGQPSVEELADRIRDGRFALPAIELRATREVIGYCGLIESDGDPELGFELLRRTWNHGYATEAARAVLDRARETGVRRVTASVWTWNTASRRVLEKLGFVEVAKEGELLETVLAL